MSPVPRYVCVGDSSFLLIPGFAKFKVPDQQITQARKVTPVTKSAERPTFRLLANAPFPAYTCHNIKPPWLCSPPAEP
jgi:hypothetical protein